MMTLYVTPGSPYARMARIMVIEKGLQSRVEIVMAQTRTSDSPYYKTNPSGRVPYLMRDDGAGIEESALICAWFDHLDGKPFLEVQGWEARRLEALARSMLDGISVWNRELARPENERSPAVIRHEADRGRRMAGVWEKEVGHPLMRGPFNMLQLTLGCTLGLEARNPGFDWRTGHARLCDWFGPIAARPSFAATAPPEAQRGR